jgi:two-component system, sensor histidine kinase PdtaS
MFKNSSMQAALSRVRHNPVQGQAIALAFVSIAFMLRLAVDPVLPPGYPYVVFFPAVLLTTFVAGLWPGVVAAVLSGLAAWYFFIPPLYSFHLDRGFGLGFVFYAVVVTVDVAVIHIMITAQERLEMERRHSAALTRQTQVMFSEMQHRVSNNLQLISSLLMISQSKVADPAALQVLEQARSRVATLGRLHRMLHDPTDQSVNMGEYLRNLCHEVFDASGATHVDWEVAAEPVEIGHDKLVPLALIVAELLSNSLEHAFAHGRPGKVWVMLGFQTGAVHLTVRDNGPGLPEAFDVDAQASLGLRIVRALAGQLGGRFTMRCNGGTVCELAFTL